jgi:hypothetical protein
MLAVISAPAEIKKLWKTAELNDPQYDRGAMDAYAGRRPQFASVQYMAGYSDQLGLLPVDEKGNVEWFRLLPEGGWKLTDNL